MEAFLWQEMGLVVVCGGRVGGEKSQILRTCDDLDMNCVEQNLRRAEGWNQRKWEI